VILCISVNNQLKRSRQIRKTMIVYFAVSLFCILFDRVYALFGHGVYSASMSLMFLYPLVGGALAFLLLWFFIPGGDNVPCYRFSYNSYNSGVAMLTIQSVLTGIFEIAGTSSPYLIVFTICGWALLSIGMVINLWNLYHRRASLA